MIVANGSRIGRYLAQVLHELQVLVLDSFLDNDRIILVTLTLFLIVNQLLLFLCPPYALTSLRPFDFGPLFIQ